MTTKISVHRRSIQVLRIMLSGIFLIAGSSHLLNVEPTVNRIDNANLKEFAYFFGDPEFLVILSGIVMLLAGLSLLTGFQTRWAAVILLLVLLPITLTIQVGQSSSLGPLFKNVAIMGGLLFFIINDFSTKEIKKTKPAQSKLSLKNK